MADAAVAGNDCFPYQVRRRPLAPTHPVFEAGNLDRETLARESAPAVSPTLQVCLYK